MYHFDPDHCTCPYRVTGNIIVIVNYVKRCPVHGSKVK